MPKEKPQVNIGEVIKTYRGQRGLSQGDIERRTGLLRCYLSRVENGHTVPSLETLAKIAEAMDISLADFFPGTETPRDKETQKMLGELSQEKINAAVLDLDPVNETAGFRQSGILGANFLKNFRVTFDFQRGVIRLEPVSNAKGTKPDQSDEDQQ